MIEDTKKISSITGSQIDNIKISIDKLFNILDPILLQELPSPQKDSPELSQLNSSLDKIDTALLLLLSRISF